MFFAWSKQAIAADPSFSEGYESLGVNYSNFGQDDLAARYLKRAVELSNRISEREKFETFAAYYSVGTRELSLCTSEI
jgi:hypothetical protein